MAEQDTPDNVPNQRLPQQVKEKEIGDYISAPRRRRRPRLRVMEKEIGDYISACRHQGVMAQPPLKGLKDEQLLFLVSEWPDIPALWLFEPMVTDDAFKAALAKTTKLESLVIEQQGETSESLSKKYILNESEVFTFRGKFIESTWMEYISTVSTLKELRLRFGIRHIQVKAFAHLQKLKSLETLEVQYDYGRGPALLDILAGMPQLKRLEAPMLRPMSAQLLKTNDAQKILNAWRNREDLQDIRVAITGMAGVGKTWLLRRCFLNEQVSVNEPRKITEDINLLHEHELKWDPDETLLDQPSRLAPHLWDFGGQLVKHGVHEIFFAAQNDRTLYVLVLSATRSLKKELDIKGENKGNGLSYWLHMIKRCAGSNAPILIVVTQCDKTKPGTKRDVDDILALKPQNFREIWGVNVLTKVIDGCSACDNNLENIARLRRAIVSGSQILKHLDNLLDPIKFRRLRMLVESRLSDKSVEPIGEYRKWCTECDVHLDKEQDLYLRAFHELGILFYFGMTDVDKAPNSRRVMRPIEPDSCLQLYIVNPAWWKKPVYDLMEGVEIEAWLGNEEIDEIIRPALSRYPASPVGTLIIRESLRYTELCFYDSTREKYLFPRALSAVSVGATASWRSVTAKFEFLTEAAFFRLTVKLHKSRQVFEEEGNYMHRRWSLIACKEDDHSTRVAIVARPDEGELEFRFDPSSDPSESYTLAYRIYETFRDDCMGRVGPSPKEVFQSSDRFASTSNEDIPAEPKKPNSLSPDNSWVRWDGDVISLTPLQGKIMRVLWEATEQLETHEILILIGTGAPPKRDFRFRKTFASCKGWEKIIQIKKGRYYSTRLLE